MEWHCNQADCPLHPIYIKQEKAEAKRKAKEEERLRLEELKNSDYIFPGQITFRDLDNLIPGQIVFDDNRLSIVGDLKINGTTDMHSISSDFTWNRAGWNELNNEIDHRSYLCLDGIDYTVPFECLACKHFEKIDMRDAIIVQRAKKALEED